MERTMELKIAGEPYAGGFSCGATMCRSSAESFTAAPQGPGKTVYRRPDGLRVTVSVRNAGGAERIRTEFTNGSAGDVTLEMLASVALKNVAADRIHRLQSFWSAEGRLRTETVEELHLERSWSGAGVRFEKFGNTGSMPVRKYFPFLALENSKTGEFTGLLLCVGGSWQIEILRKEDDTLSVSGGLADGDFGQWEKTLAPGESFLAPEAILAVGKSLEDVCHRLVSAQEPAISPEDTGMGVVFNEFCSTWSKPDLKKVKEMCDVLAGRGVRYMVIDSGWYGHDNWWECVGDWEVNEERFPGGMKPAADYIRSRGMVPGLWFEPEAVGPGCRYYNDPTHLLKKNGVPLTVGGRRFWDMEDPWVREYLGKKVIGLVREGGFGYVKIDYNDSIGVGVDGAESRGEGLRRKIEASREFFRLLAREIPGLVIENCSSGGHRLTPAFMELSSQGSFSDAHETLAIPIIAANLHRVVRPDQSQIWAVLRAGDSDDRLFYTLCAAFLGRMCLSGDVCGLDAHRWEIVDRAIAFYNGAAEIIKNGMTVRLTRTGSGYNDPRGSQIVVRAYKNRALAVVHRFRDSAMPEGVLPENARIIDSFGSARGDFTAQAWLYDL